MEDYLALLKEVFDFDLLRTFIARPDFSLTFDALHAVTGAYAGPILVDELGAPADSIRRATTAAGRGGSLCAICVGVVAALHDTPWGAGTASRWKTLAAAIPTPI